VRHALTPLLIAEALVFGALGLLLLLLPETAAAVWPWALPPLLGQLYSCFVLTFAVGAALTARESSPLAVRNFLIASLSLTVLVLCVSVLHFDRFKPEPVTAIWFAAFGNSGCCVRRRGRTCRVARLAGRARCKPLL